MIHLLPPREFKVNNCHFTLRVFIPITCCTKGELVNRIYQWKPKIDLTLRTRYTTPNLVTVFKVAAPFENEFYVRVL